MSFMPEVKMDFIPEDMTDDEIASPREVEVEDVKTQDEASEEDEEDLIKKVIPKSKSKRDDMNINDIFNMPPSFGAKEQETQPNVKLTKKGKPRKQRPPMSEEHKQKLALAREKAMEARKKKAQERKENKALETEEKELLKKQKVKRVNQLKEEVLEEPYASEKINKESSFSKKDLEDAQLQAIMNYEKIRKQRKEEKKEKLKKEAEQEALKAQLRQAVAPPKQEYNPFSGCY